MEGCFLSSHNTQEASNNQIRRLEASSWVLEVGGQMPPLCTHTASACWGPSSHGSPFTHGQSVSHGKQDPVCTILPLGGGPNAQPFPPTMGLFSHNVYGSGPIRSWERIREWIRAFFWVKSCLPQSSLVLSTHVRISLQTHSHNWIPVQS